MVKCFCAVYSFLILEESCSIVGREAKKMIENGETKENNWDEVTVFCKNEKKNPEKSTEINIYQNLWFEFIICHLISLENSKQHDKHMRLPEFCYELLKPNINIYVYWASKILFSLDCKLDWKKVENNSFNGLHQIERQKPKQNSLCSVFVLFYFQYALIAININKSAANLPKCILFVYAKWRNSLNESK